MPAVEGPEMEKPRTPSTPAPKADGEEATAAKSILKLSSGPKLFAPNPGPIAEAPVRHMSYRQPEATPPATGGGWKGMRPATTASSNRNR